MRPIFDWAETLWGKDSQKRWRVIVEAPQLKPITLAELPQLARRPRCELTRDQKQKLIDRDGLRCRYCGIPLIRSEVRGRIRKAYPKALRWDKGNCDKHAAFLAMDVQFDHVAPFSRNGTDEIDNFVVACAPCNCGRMNNTLDEVGLLDPRLRDPIPSSWDGLARFP